MISSISCHERMEDKTLENLLDGLPGWGGGGVGEDCYTCSVVPRLSGSGFLVFRHCWHSLNPHLHFLSYHMVVLPGPLHQRWHRLLNHPCSCVWEVAHWHADANIKSCSWVTCPGSCCWAEMAAGENAGACCYPGCAHSLTLCGPVHFAPVHPGLLCLSTASPCSCLSVVLFPVRSYLDFWSGVCWGHTALSQAMLPLELPS